MKITIAYESSWRNSFLDGSNNEDYILVDSLNNDIRISRKNVEYILIDKNETEGM